MMVVKGNAFMIPPFSTPHVPVNLLTQKLSNILVATGPVVGSMGSNSVSDLASLQIVLPTEVYNLRPISEITLQD